MASAPGANKEYSAIDGDPEFVSKALAFAYGAESEALASGRVAGVQTISGTGACRIGGEFYARFGGAGTFIYVSDPSWCIHLEIMKAAGLEVRRYRYFDGESKGLDFAGMCEDLEAAPEGSVVLLHACAHNPTGVDPTPEQWAKVADLCARRGLHVFFDSAYQGFASGDADADGSAFRSFVARAGDFPSMCLAQSFAKNFGLYGERVGTFSVVCGDSDQAAKVLSQLKLIIRPMYSSPPIHGAGIVKTVLADAELTKQYKGEVGQRENPLPSHTHPPTLQCTGSVFLGTIMAPTDLAVYSYVRVHLFRTISTPLDSPHLTRPLRSVPAVRFDGGSDQGNARLAAHRARGVRLQARLEPRD